MNVMCRYAFVCTCTCTCKLAATHTSNSHLERLVLFGEIIGQVEVILRRPLLQLLTAKVKVQLDSSVLVNGHHLALTAVPEKTPRPT